MSDIALVLLAIALLYFGLQRKGLVFFIASGATFFALAASAGTDNMFIFIAMIGMAITTMIMGFFGVSR